MTVAAVPGEGSLAPESAGAVENHHAWAPDEPAVAAVFLGGFLLDVSTELSHSFRLLKG